MMIYEREDQRENSSKFSADCDGLKMGRAAQKIFESVLVTKKKPSAEPDYRGNFSEFCGLWTASDLRAFESLTANTRRIDPEDWE